jgi:hypothetical protein
MSNAVQLANADFTFSSLALANPQGLQGGAYFSKLRIGDDPVLIQTPKCYTKNGIHKTEKKVYCDLMFTGDNYNFIQWVESLESTVKSLIYEKRKLWFHNDMEHDSIDYHWQNLLRTYKGNKSLLRCFINKSKGINKGYTVQIYDEEEEELKLEDVDKTTQMIAILEVAGLKFTSQSFQIEFAVKQMMVIKEKALFNKCLIKFNTPKVVDAVKDNIPEIVESDVESDISIEDAAELEVKPDSNVNESKETADVKSPNLKTDTEVTIEDLAGLVEPVNDVEEDDKQPNHVVGEPDEKTVEKVDVQIHLQDPEKTTDEKTDIPAALKENLAKVVETQVQSIIQKESLDKDGIMNEIEILPPSENAEMVKLKNPNEVYMEIYKEARRKAKDAKKHAIQAYLEAKRIKSLYLLDEMDSSDDDVEFEEYDQ